MFLFVWSLSVHLWHRHTNSGENFYVFNQSIFQLSDIEEWPDTDTDQHMLQLDVLLVSAQLLKDSSSSKTSYTEDTRWWWWWWWGALTWAWSQHLWLGGWRWRPLGGWCLPSRACRRRRLRAWCHHYWRPERRCWSGTCGTDTGASCWRGPRCSQSRLSHLVEGEDHGQPWKDLGCVTAEIWIYNNCMLLVQSWHFNAKGHKKIYEL